MRIGTRGSALALAQAEWVAARLAEHGVEAELVRITTPGDRGEQLGDKARWVSELERALVEDEIDAAVHSAKDVPAELAEGTELSAIPAREDPRDALCGAPSLDDLVEGARVGTSSLRRGAQLRALRPDLEIVELRGNVDTRLRKLAAGEADAIVLALAGLRRLGRDSEAGGALTGLIPAAGQGALALQARAGSAAAAALAALGDPDATACVGAERALTRALGASCHTAVGAYARRAERAVSASGSALASGSGEVTLDAWVGLPDGSEWLSDQLTGAPDEVGAAVAARMLAAGAAELLARAEGSCQN